jgi:hypothetical protein
MIEAALLAKFGEEARALLPAILEMFDAEEYLALNRTIVTAATLDEVRRACAWLAVARPGARRAGMLSAARRRRRGAGTHIARTSDFRKIRER